MHGDDATEKKDDEVLGTVADGASRQRSTIGFPYMDLDDALEVASAIHDNVGQGECDEDQLAAWLQLSVKSSGFLRLKA